MSAPRSLPSKASVELIAAWISVQCAFYTGFSGNSFVFFGFFQAFSLPRPRYEKMALAKRRRYAEEATAEWKAPTIKAKNALSATKAGFRRQGRGKLRRHAFSQIALGRSES